MTSCQGHELVAHLACRGAAGPGREKGIEERCLSHRPPVLTFPLRTCRPFLGAECGSGCGAQAGRGSRMEPGAPRGQGVGSRRRDLAGTEAWSPHICAIVPSDTQNVHSKMQLFSSASTELQNSGARPLCKPSRAACGACVSVCTGHTRENSPFFRKLLSYLRKENSFHFEISDYFSPSQTPPSSSFLHSINKQLSGTCHEPDTV